MQRVECGCVCADEQSPHNLISTNPRLRTRGCRVEHFIRPPVHLEFQFSAPVHVACILVRPSLTENTEARIEIAGSLNLPNSEGHYYKPCGNSLIKGENSVLVFRNKVFERKFGEMKFASELSVLGSSVVSRLVCLQLIEQPMKHSHVLYTMKCLKLSVAYFTGHKPAAIQSLEVWGILSQSCSALEKETAQRLIADLQAKPPFSNPLDCNMGVYNSHRQHKTNPLQINPLDHNSFESQINSDEIHGTQSHGAQSHGAQSHEAQSCGTQSHGTGDFRTHCTLSPCGYLMKYAHLEECCVRDQTGMEEDSHMKGLTKRRRFLGIHQPVSTQLASRNPTRIPCIVLPPDNSEPLLDTQLDRGSNSNKPHSIGSKLQAVTSCSTASFGVPAPQQGEGKREALKSRGAVTVDTCVRCPGGHDPIPEKFLDEITCDVMAVPMLLPSGHYVDKDTLDKLMHTDAIYGRTPSDPFTGKKRMLLSAAVYFQYWFVTNLYRVVHQCIAVRFAGVVHQCIAVRFAGVVHSTMYITVRSAIISAMVTEI